MTRLPGGRVQVESTGQGDGVACGAAAFTGTGTFHGDSPFGPDKNVPACPVILKRIGRKLTVDADSGRDCLAQRRSMRTLAKVRHVPDPNWCLGEPGFWKSRM